MPTVGRMLAVIMGLLLVAGAATFLFFRSSIASEGVYRVATAVGLDAPEPERHIVPEGFQGWAVVHYGEEGAPPLRREDDALIVEYPEIPSVTGIAQSETTAALTPRAAASLWLNSLMPSSEPYSANSPECACALSQSSFIVSGSAAISAIA